TRQDAVDGLVLRVARVSSARTQSLLSLHAPSACGATHCHPPRAAARDRRAAAGAAGSRDLPGRILRRGHRRCDDPRRAVRGTVPPRRDAGRDLEYFASGPVQGPAAARTLSAGPGFDEETYGCGALGWRHRLSPA